MCDFFRTSCRARVLNPLLATAALWLAASLAGCEGQWNNPHAEADPDEAVYYGSFRARPKHLDPARAYSSDEAVFIGQIYEPPFQYHYLKRPYQVVPRSAASMPEVVWRDEAGDVTEDLNRAVTSEYTIEIKPGVEYQPHPALARHPEGGYRYHQLDESDLAGKQKLSDFAHRGSRELVAEDYVYQVKRLADPAVQSPVSGLFARYIEGFTEFTKTLNNERDDGGEADLRELDMAGVEALGRYRYRIRLNQVYPQFIYWLSMNFFAPMPWEADAFYQQPGMAERNIVLDWYPIGTGPFMLTENNPNLRMVLERNPHFDHETYPEEGDPGDREAGLLDDAGEPLPLLDKAIYSLEKEQIPYWNKFLQGYYDTSGVSSDSFDQAFQFSGGDLELNPELAEKNIGMVSSTTALIYYTGFNMRDDLVGGDSERARLLRRAIAIAVDYEEFISIFLNGRGTPAQGPIPPGIFGGGEVGERHNPYVYDWENGRRQRKPISEARALLERAGYPDGIDPDTGKPLIVYLDTPASGPDSKSILQWMMKQFDKIGLNLVVRSTDYNRFREKMSNGTAQLFQWGWGADYPDPENFLFLLYGPNAKVDSNGENAANYRNPEFDRLFERMKNMSNSEERLELIKEMTSIAQRDAPWLFGYTPKSYVLYHDWYGNVKPNTMARNTLKYKKIEGHRRAQLRARWNQPVVWPLWLVAGLVLIVVIPAVWRYRQSQQRGVL
ncbi:MAG: ABC transporter substrate-binding protein [Pseudomonadota bacterium]